MRTRVGARIQALAGAWALAQSVAVIPQGAPPPPPRVATHLAPEVQALVILLLSWAGSVESADHASLRAALADPVQLDLLDPPDVRDLQRPVDLQLARILEQLRTSASPRARQTLASLVELPTFASDEVRQELLVRALGMPGELPAASLRFLDQQAGPESVNLHPAIAALCANGSRPALDVVGRKLNDARFPLAERVGWMRYHLLARRRSPPLVEWAFAWLAVPERDPVLRGALVEVLFDHRPNDWFPSGDNLVRAPSEDGLGMEVREGLGRLARLVKSGDYEVRLREAAARWLEQHGGD